MTSDASYHAEGYDTVWGEGAHAEGIETHAGGWVVSAEDNHVISVGRDQLRVRRLGAGRELGPWLDATPPGWVASRAIVRWEGAYLHVTLHASTADQEELRAPVRSVEAGQPVWQRAQTVWVDCC